MHTMHLLPNVAIQANLELKTWPKQLLGSLLLVTELHECRHALCLQGCPHHRDNISLWPTLFTGQREREREREKEKEEGREGEREQENEKEGERNVEYVQNCNFYFLKE